MSIETKHVLSVLVDRNVKTLASPQRLSRCNGRPQSFAVYMPLKRFQLKSRDGISLVTATVPFISPVIRTPITNLSMTLIRYKHSDIYISVFSYISNKSLCRRCLSSGLLHRVPTFQRCLLLLSSSP